MDNKQWKETGLSALAVIGGVMVGSAIKKALDKTTESVSGLSGQVSNYVIPAILTIGGVAANGMTKSSILKDVALGVTAVGGAGIINEAMGRSVVSLGSLNATQQKAFSLPVSSRAINIPRQSVKSVEPVFNPINGVEGTTSIPAGGGFGGVL